MLMRKKIIIFDQDNSTVETMAPLVKRNSDLMRSLLFSKRVLDRLPADLREKARRDPEGYFIGEIIRLKDDFYGAAERAGVEVWDKRVVLPQTEFMKTHWKRAERATHHYLRQHFRPLAINPFPGMAETIRRFKDEGAILVMLTDAVPQHAMSTALASGFVDGHFDLVISRDEMRPVPAGAPLTLAPYTATLFERTPHYVVGNSRAYPKKHAEVHDMVAALLGAEKTDMVLIDDHIGICNIARDAGVDALLAYYGSVGDEFRRNLKWLREWTEYYATQDDFHEAMTRDPDVAANGHKVLRCVEDIARHIQPVAGAALPYVNDRAAIRMNGGRPELFTP